MAVSNDKPALADSDHNLWMERPDRVVCGLSLNDADSGDASDGDLVNGWGSRYDDGAWGTDKLRPTVYTAGDGPTWVTGSANEGGGLSFDMSSGNAIKLYERAGADQPIPRGTIVMRMKISTAGLTGGPILCLGDGQSGLRLRILGSPNIKVTKMVGGVPTNILESPTIVADTFYTFILSWGEGGIKFYDGATWQTDSDTFEPSLKTGSLSTLFAIYSGGWQAFCDGTLTAFAWYEWQLRQDQLDELVVDPYLYMRQDPDEDYFEAASGPLISRTSTTGTTLSFTTGASVADDAAHRVYVRCLYSTDARLATYSTSSTAAGTTALARLNLTLSGLSAGTTYYAVTQYKIGDSGTWINMPGGRVVFNTFRAAGSSFRFAVYSDTHFKDSGIGMSAAHTQFLDYDDASNYGLSCMFRDMRKQCEDEDVDFFLALGDNVASASVTSATIRDDYQLWRRFFGCIHKRATHYHAIGNWEFTAGWRQYSGYQKMHHEEWQRFTCNPDDEGGNSYGDWVPAEGYENDDGDTVDATWLATKIHTGNPENYYAITDGDVTIFVLDPFRYARVAQRDADYEVQAPYTLGDTQWAWLEAQLAACTSKYIILATHHLPGGYKSNFGGTPTWYARGLSTHLGMQRLQQVNYSETEQEMDGADQLSEAGSRGIKDEIRFLTLAKKYGATIITAHNHQFGHGVCVAPWDGVNVISIPQYTDRYNFDNSDGYGTPALLGSDKASEGVEQADKLGGYVIFTVTDSTLSIEVRRVVECCSTSDYEAQTTPGFVGDHVSEEMDTGGGGTTLALSEVPDHVFCVGTPDACDFATYGSPAIETDLAGENLYDPTHRDTQFTDGWGSTAYEEPHQSATITLSSATGDTACADAVPCSSYSATLTIPDRYAPRLTPWAGGGRLFSRDETIAAKRDICVAMQLDSDTPTPAIGVEPVVSICKAGAGTFTTITGSVAEVTIAGEATGTFRISLAAADLDTEGAAILYVAAPGAATQLIPIEVVLLHDEVHSAKATVEGTDTKVDTVDGVVDAINVVTAALANVDSTGTEAITAAKALEVMLAVLAGKASVSQVDGTTNRVSFIGRDGTTVLMQVDVSANTSGSRLVSEVDPS
jgi:hypothetical protein